jgi:MFS family permease
MLSFFRTKEVLEPADVDKGMRMLMYDGAFAQTMVVFTTGGFLIGFALELGASNTVVGVISAVGPLFQIVQLPSIFLVERIRLRRMLTVVTAFAGRMSWIAIAGLPFLVDERFRIPLFLLLLAMHYGLGAVAGCAYNSWIRDVIPIKSFGTFFARRMAVATFTGAVLSVAGAILVDWYRDNRGTPMPAYAIVFLIAAASGLIAVCALGRIAEPTMPADTGGSLANVLRQPFRDANFRQLLIFLGLWNFAVNFAAPFFAVYLLRRLGLSMTWVIGLSVLSQIVNVLFFRLWGRTADRFSNKSVLAISGPLFIFSFLMWPFTTLPDRHMFTIPLLIAIHVLAGISTAGVTLCAGNLAFKLAPYGKATAYLAVNALICGVAATISPILAGIAGDWFDPYELKISLEWLNWRTPEVAETAFVLPTVDFRGLDFVFSIAFLLGLIALHRLLAVKEEGEVEEALVRQELLLEMRRVARQVSTVAGMRMLTAFPYGTLKQWRKRRREPERWIP